jgi:uncharacterized membrane protein YgdD (TMEM256/DUF423 family)
MCAAKLWLGLGALLGALGVGLGAYGAHGLEKSVTAVVEEHAGSAATSAEKQAEIAKRIENWKTAAQYQMTHIAALLAIGLATARWPMKRWCFAGAMMLAGMAMFSGVLYAQAFMPERNLGLVVMFGGLSYIAGWLVLASAALGIGGKSENCG